VTGAANARTIENLYGPIAGDYEQLWAPLLRPYGIRVLDGLPLAGASRVLELGCGVGRLLPDIAERAPTARVIGTDLVTSMLARAPAVFPRIAMDCSRPAFAPQSFDAVVAAFMLFHVPDPLAAVVCAREALRPGGGFGVAVWGAGGSCPGVEVWAEVLDAAGVPPDPVGSGEPDGEEQVNGPDKLGTLLEQAGFADVRAEPVPWDQRWDLDGFMRLRTRMGPGRRRLGLLPETERAACIARVRERLAAMPAETLRDRDQVVLAWATAPSRPAAGPA
jgi:SAM-dependent methyltransferase